MNLFIVSLNCYGVMNNRKTKWSFACFILYHKGRRIKRAQERNLHIQNAWANTFPRRYSFLIYLWRLLFISVLKVIRCVEWSGKSKVEMACGNEIYTPFFFNNKMRPLFILLFFFLFLMKSDYNSSRLFFYCNIAHYQESKKLYNYMPDLNSRLLYLK